MKLIINDNRVTAAATDEYLATGREQAILDAPADFDVLQLGKYSFVNGALSDVPQKISRRQGLRALTERGHMLAVHATIDAIEDPVQRELARVDFANAQEFERYWPLVVQIGAVLQLDLDELFRFAGTL